MRYIIIFIISFFSFLNCFAADNLASLVQQEINKVDPNIHIGIKIRNLKEDKVIFALNNKKYFTFASGIKFITLTSLADKFSLDYKFRSQILTNGSDYYLHIHDPDFNDNDLQELIKQLVKQQITHIKGNFYIVKDDFTIAPVARGKIVADTVYCYGAPITKVHVNKNCSKLIAEPTMSGKKIAITETNKEVMPYNIVNTAETIKGNVADMLYTSIKDDKYIIDGTLNIATGKVTIGAVVRDNYPHVKYMLKKTLSNHNIALSGKILLQEKPKDLTEIASKEKTFANVATIAMKKSDNFITDYLLAEYASKYNAREWRDAGALLKELVFSNYKVDIKKSNIFDGCGLCPFNLFTVDQFDAILTAVAKSQNFAKTIKFLANPGDVNSNFKERFQDLSRENKKKIFAKTGKLTDTCSIVGYFYNNDNELHSFVIVINNIYGNKNKYKKLQENIITLLIQR